MSRRKHNHYSQIPGEVYLVHFASRLHHAGHYIGFAEYDMDGNSTLLYRIQRHRNSTGSKLITAVNDNGIDWNIALSLDGTQLVERLLHKAKSSPDFCLVCAGAHNAPKIIQRLKHLYDRAGADWTEENEQKVHKIASCIESGHLDRNCLIACDNCGSKIPF